MKLIYCMYVALLEECSPRSCFFESIIVQDPPPPKKLA